jgi:hypothetical protein
MKVLYIAGCGRSGSTILDNILGQVDGFASVGEIRYLWQRGIIDDRLCGCGEPFSSCPFWTDVMERAGTEVGTVEAGRVVGLLARGTRARHVPWLLRARKRPDRIRERLSELPDVLARVYDAVAATSGARVIVDSSKLPTYGELLRHVPGIDPFVVHLVRDPRATAFSWSRAKPLPARDGGVMQRQTPLKSASLWMTWNASAEGFWGDGPRSFRVRYEDFIGDPRAVVERIVRLVGEEPADLPFTSPTEVTLATTHGVAGNPSRFTTGTVTLRLDDAWREAMPPGDRRLVTAITAPLAYRYRYLATGARPRL